MREKRLTLIGMRSPVLCVCMSVSHSPSRTPPGVHACSLLQPSTGCLLPSRTRVCVYSLCLDSEKQCKPPFFRRTHVSFLPPTKQRERNRKDERGIELLQACEASSSRGAGQDSRLGRVTRQKHQISLTADTSPTFQRWRKERRIESTRFRDRLSLRS